MPSRISVTLEPDVRRWAQAAESWHDVVARSPDWRFQGKTLAHWRSMTREELGLPAHAIVIATGHQAAIWHPGILVKYMAADVLVRTIGRHSIGLDVIVDQDANEFRSIEAPAHDDADRLAVRRVPLFAEAPNDPDRPVASYSAAPPEPLGPAGAWALPSVAAGLERIQRVLAAHSHQPNAAAQLASSLQDLRSPWVSAMSRVFASALLATSFGRALIEAMAVDPRGCAGTYNTAIVRVAGSGLARLDMNESSVELPLWRIDGQGRRRPVDASELRSIEPASLRPRALTMTAILRSAVADLFIHGRGGFVYDRAMEGWMKAWLGVPVAPMALATADVPLPLESPVDLSVGEAVIAHRRRLHDPTWSGGDGPSVAKQAFLERIRRAPRRSAARRAAFDAYHQWLREARSTHHEAVGDSRRLVEAAIAGRAGREIAHRRDWAFPLYADDTLSDLLDAVSDELARADGGAPAPHRSIPAADWPGTIGAHAE